MKTRKVPIRTCIISKEKLPKQELIRIVKTKDGKVFIDDTGKASGRGVYLKKDTEIINKAKKNKIIDRYLEIEMDENIYEELLKLL